MKNYELKLELSKDEFIGIWEQVESALSSVIEYSESYELDEVEDFNVKNQIKGLEKLIDTMVLLWINN